MKTRILVLVAGLALHQLASAAEAPDQAAVRAIRAARPTSTLGELTAIVRTSAACCSGSAEVAAALTQWLRESHRIYAGRLPTDATQFRGFLLASLAVFPRSEELYSYAKTEFLFAGHPLSIATAAVAARNYPEKSDELLPLMEPFLDYSFDDAPVDVTTPELNYPLAHPTRARDEIIRTLVAFGPRAYRSLPRLDAIVRCENCGTYALDPALPRRAAEAAEAIRGMTPESMRNAAATAYAPPSLHVIDRRERKALSSAPPRLLDQDGRTLQLADLHGRPFVLTFFYSQCTNAMKCVATLRRLSALSAACTKDDLAGRVGIYGMTYDTHFDTPVVLMHYGKKNGLTFTPTVRLFKPVGALDDAFREELALRVSYGAGSVNQHGVQLFLFDKKGRLAATLDNEVWSATDVKNALAKLAAE